MQRHLFPIIVLLGLTASAVYLLAAKPVVAAQSEQSSAVFDSEGKVELPTGFRAWVFVGAPLKPDGLNNGKANFPEPKLKRSSPAGLNSKIGGSVRPTQVA